MNHTLVALSKRKHTLANLSHPQKKRLRRSTTENKLKVTRGVEEVGEMGVDEVIDHVDSANLGVNISKGLMLLGQILQSTWWQWMSGSAPVFWRWNGSKQILAARDGMRIFVQSTLPRSQKGVKLPRFDTDTRKMVASKIETMAAKSYLESGSVKTSLHYFAVAKGESDIRVVFDGTSCGLNEALWSQTFSSPLPETPLNCCPSTRGWRTSILVNSFTTSSPTIRFGNMRE